MSILSGRAALAGLALSGAVLALSLSGAPAFAKNPMVGGAAMYADKPIAVNASHAKNLTTLVAAAKAAGLVDTLAGPGPFTVFAPTNTAFKALPKGTVETLLKPENVDKLKGILLGHVVPGDLSPADLDNQIKDGGGKAVLKTAGGDSLTVMKSGKGFSVTDGAGGTAKVEISDVKQSNGVVYVINKVLLPAG